MSEEILRNPWLVNIVVMLVLIWFSVEDIRLRSIDFKGIMIVITAGIIYRVLYILLFREVEIYSIITGILIIAGTGIYSVKTGIMADIGHAKQVLARGDVTVILFIGVVKGLEFALVSTMMALEGRLQTRQYEDKDKNKRYFTEIVMDNFVLIDRIGDEDDSKK